MPIIASKWFLLCHMPDLTLKSASVASREHAFKHAFDTGAVAIKLSHRDQPSSRFAKKS